MNRQELEQQIKLAYGVKPDRPWMDYPEYEVFRHPANRKWFALAMVVPRAKLGLAGEGAIDVLNLKCDPLLIGSLRGKPGYFPAYHMSKASWITVALNGEAEDDEILWLVDLSYSLTAPKMKAKKKPKREEA